MKRLTKAEEEIMQIIWRLGRCTVLDIRKDIGGEPLRKHTSVSTIVRLLEKNDFVSHKAYGRTYEYYPIIAKEDYSKQTLHKFVNEYFEGSMNRLVSFMVKEEDLKLDELSDLLDKLEE